MQPPLRRSSSPAASRSDRAPANDEGARLLALALECPHAFHSADGFARRAGLRNRHHLNRILRDAGLPTFRNISTLVRLSLIVRAAADQRDSICAVCQRNGLDPAWVYRSLKRLTGRGWKELRSASALEILRLACVVCRERTRRRPPTDRRVA